MHRPVIASAAWHRRMRKGAAWVAAPLFSLSVVSIASTGSPAGAATKFTGAPIAIGTTQPLNTIGLNHPGNLEVATATVDQINAAGGIKTRDGKTHKLTLDFCNNEFTPNGTVTC